MTAFNNSQKLKIEINKIYDYTMDSVVKCKVKRIFQRGDGEIIALVERFSKYGIYGVSNISIDFLGNESILTKKDIEVLISL